MSCLLNVVYVWVVGYAGLADILCGTLDLRVCSIME